MPEASALHQRWQFPNPDYYTYIDNLADRITELSGHLNAANYQLLKLIGDFDENEGWRGYNSCAHFLNHRCGTSSAHRLARQPRGSLSICDSACASLNP